LEETDEKLVVFAYHKPIIQQLQERYNNISVVIDGSTPMHKRKQIIQTFQEQNNTRLFIGNIIAAGTVITLTAASTVAFVELDFVPSNHIQAEDRVHRIGQTNKVSIYYLIAKDTIEQDLCRIIQKKAIIVSSVLDGENINDKLDVFDQLMKIIQERKLL